MQIGSCVSACDTGFYPLGSVCTTCPVNCSSCVSALSCTGCSNGNYLDLNSCVATCPSQRPIADASGKCSTCTDAFCVTCDLNNICYSCYFPRLLVQGTCQASCPVDYVVSSNGTACVYSPTTTTNTTTIIN